jgi:hypothetical protein
MLVPFHIVWMPTADEPINSFSRANGTLLHRNIAAEEHPYNEAECVRLLLASTEADACLKSVPAMKRRGSIHLERHRAVNTQVLCLLLEHRQPRFVIRMA